MNKTRKIDFVPDRLRAVMKEKRYTRSSLCSALGLNIDTYAGYMKTARIIPDELGRICKLLDTDADYIAGITDEDAGFTDELNAVSSEFSINYTVKITRSELLALLLEMYGFRADLIQEAQASPDRSELVQFINDDLIRYRDDPGYRWNHPGYDPKKNRLKRHVEHFTEEE